MKNRLLPISLSLVVICACSSTDTKDIKDSPEEPTPNVTYTAYANNIFSIDVPSTWEVFSQEGTSVPSHISVEKKDGSGLVTISVAKTPRDIYEDCKLMANNLIDDPNNLSLSSQVTFGTCKVSGINHNKPVGIWARSTSDKVLYSIYYEGNLQTVAEILSSLQGTEEIMNLLVDTL